MRGRQRPHVKKGTERLSASQDFHIIGRDLQPVSEAETGRRVVDL
jgi:hypothetical protein